jgi:hypothetical protein
MPTTLSTYALSSSGFVTGVNDLEIAAEVSLAQTMLEDAGLAHDVVGRALAQLTQCAATTIDNRRDRYDAEAPRASYRSLIAPHVLFRILVLDEIEQAQQASERNSPSLATPQDLLRRYVITQVKSVLNHNSFWGAVCVGQVFCRIPAPDVLDMYVRVAPDRSDSKDAPACTRVKRVLLKRTATRFHGLLEVAKDAGEYRLKSRQPTACEVQFVAENLDLLLPAGHASFGAMSNERAPALQKRLEESGFEMERVRQFLIPANFDGVAGTCGLGTFADHLLIPEFSTPHDGEPPGRNSLVATGTNAFTVDVERVKQSAAKERNRRSRLAPGSLRIVVDGVERAAVPESGSCRLSLEEGACMIKVQGFADNFEPITLGTHVLVYDSPRVDLWDVAVKEFGDLQFQLEYREDDTVDVLVRSRPLLNYTLADYLDQYKVVLCIGMGGSGKSTISYVLSQIREMGRNVFVSTCDAPITRVAPLSGLSASCREVHCVCDDAALTIYDVSLAPDSINTVRTARWRHALTSLRGSSQPLFIDAAVAIFDAEWSDRVAIERSLDVVCRFPVGRTIFAFDDSGCVGARQARGAFHDEAFEVIKEYRRVNEDAYLAFVPVAHAIPVALCRTSIARREIVPLTSRIDLHGDDVHALVERIDNAVLEQADIVMRYAAWAEQHGMSAATLPHMHKELESISRHYLLAFALAGAASLAFPLASSVGWLEHMGGRWLAVANAASLLGFLSAAASLTQWWSYASSSRLSRRYRELELAVKEMQAFYADAPIGTHREVNWRRVFVGRAALALTHTHCLRRGSASEVMELLAQLGEQELAATLAREIVGARPFDRCDLPATLGRVLLPNYTTKDARKYLGQSGEAMATKKRAFISFDYDHDEGAKIMLAGQARLDDSPFDFTDASLKTHLEGDWKDKVRRRMDNIDVVIVLCGEYTHNAAGVAAEVAIAQEKSKSYFLLSAYSDKTCTKPTSARSTDKLYKWTWENLKTLVGGGR